MMPFGPALGVIMCVSKGGGAQDFILIFTTMSL